MLPAYALVSTYQKIGQGRTTSKMSTGSKSHEEKRLAHLVRSHRRDTIEQIVECWLRWAGVQTQCITACCRPVTVLIVVYCQKCLRACEHKNWTIEQWKNAVWSDESCFLLHHVDGRVHMQHLSGEHMVSGCTIGLFCWETWPPCSSFHGNSIPWWMWLFQQHNVPCHKAERVKEWFEMTVSESIRVDVWIGVAKNCPDATCQTDNVRYTILPRAFTHPSK